MGPNISKLKDPHDICIFLILYDFPLDLVRKISPGSQHNRIWTESSKPPFPSPCAVARFSGTLQICIYFQTTCNICFECRAQEWKLASSKPPSSRLLHNTPQFPSLSPPGRFHCVPRIQKSGGFWPPTGGMCMVWGFEPPPRNLYPKGI